MHARRWCVTCSSAQGHVRAHGVQAGGGVQAGHVPLTQIEIEPSEMIKAMAGEGKEGGRARGDLSALAVLKGRGSLFTCCGQ
jgi:hypothetical protein